MAKFRLFRETKKLENSVDRFFLLLSEASVIYRLAVRTYLRERVSEEFTARLKQVHEIETEADVLRRAIEKDIYSEMLIPDARGDVLGLIETSDEIFSLFASSLWAFSNEKPQITDELKAEYRRLTNMVIKAVEELASGCQVFFRSPHLVPTHTAKVVLFEREADTLSKSLKIQIFSNGLNLQEKLHLREFVDCIKVIADRSEDVSDRLTIYALKRQS